MDQVLAAIHQGNHQRSALLLGLSPLKRSPQFEAPLNRTTAAPLTAILATLAPRKGDLLRSSVHIALRPARSTVCRRAHKCLRRLASPFFRDHPRLAHAYQ